MGWTLVTGGAQHLGAELCRTLASAGYDIVVHYNTSHDQAEEIADFCRRQGVKAATIKGDFSTKESTLSFIGSYLQTFPETQNLINNVGNYLIKPALKTYLDEWYDLFQTNLHAPFSLIQALIPAIKDNRGSIVNIGVAGVDNICADTYSTAYRCTKLSLLMLTKSLAKELASLRVRVNMVSPGYLETSVDLPVDFNKLPMGTPVKFSEVAAVVVFLLSPQCSQITGQNIEVAGGVQL